MGKSSVLRAEFSDLHDWNRADIYRKIAILRTLAAPGDATPAEFGLLREVLQGTRASGNSTGDRGGMYAAAQAWADSVLSQRLTGGLSEGIGRFLSELGVKYKNDAWGVLLAYVLAVEKGGGASDLSTLETFMNLPPDEIYYSYEQVYFSVPEAWAKTLVRSGQFAAYARPRMGPDGAPMPSRLQEMLSNKEKPLFVAAALRAMALARDPSFKEKPVERAGSAPNIYPASERPAGGGLRTSFQAAHPELGDPASGD